MVKPASAYVGALPNGGVQSEGSGGVRGVGHPWGTPLLEAGGPLAPRPRRAQLRAHLLQACRHLTLCRELDFCPLLLAVLGAPSLQPASPSTPPCPPSALGLGTF